MTVGTQAGAVQPGLGQRVDDLRLGAPEHLRHHRRGSDAHQQHMAQTHAVEAVLQRDDALDLVRLDHGRQHVAHQQRRLAGRHVALGQVVRHGKNATQVVRRMAPFGGQPGVVVVQPADDATDVPRRFHRVEPELGAGHARAMGNHGAFHQRPQQLRALRKAQRQKATAQGVHQTVAGSVVGFVRTDFVVGDIARDIHELLVRGGSGVEFHIG